MLKYNTRGKKYKETTGLDHKLTVHLKIKTNTIIIVTLDVHSEKQAKFNGRMFVPNIISIHTLCATQKTQNQQVTYYGLFIFIPFYIQILHDKQLLV